MADSRYASRKLFGKQWKLTPKVVQFIIVVIGSLLLSWFIMGNEASEREYYTFVLLLMSVGLWVTEAIPPFAVAIMIMGYMVYMLGNLLPPDESHEVMKYINTLSSPIIWLLLGGFFLAHGMKRTRLDLDLFKMAGKAFGSKPNNILLGLMLTTMFSSMIMSNTAATAMMIASVMPFIRSLEKNAPVSKAILLGIPTAATLGGMGTIIGSPPNAVAVALLSENGTEVNFMTWMFYGLLPALVLVLSFWIILTRKFKSDRETIDLNIDEDAEETVSPMARRAVLAVLLLTVFLWLTSSWHGWPVAAVAFLPIVFLPVLGIVKANDFNSMPWDTLILVAGGLSLGMALEDAGIIKRFVSAVDVSALHPMFIMLIFGWITVILSNIMSNTAASSVLIPVSITILPAFSATIAVVVALSASCALLLPVSTPPNAMAFSTGYIQQKDFRLGGVIMGIFGPVLAVLWVSLVQFLIG